MANSWTVAASTGAIDERAREHMIVGRRPPPPVNALPGTGVSDIDFNSANIFGEEDSVVSLSPNSPNLLFSLRYHVPIRPIIPGRGNTLQVRYLLDDHDNGRIVVLVKKISFTNPNPTEQAEIIAVLDSNKNPANSEFQTQQISYNDDLDDDDFCYFIEAILINQKAQNPFDPQVPFGQSKLAAPAISLIRLAPAFGNIID